MRFGRKEKQQTGRRQVISGERPAAFSYHANRTEQEYNLGRQQPREQDTRRRERLVRYWRQRLGMLVAGIALIVCVVSVLHLNSKPKVISLTPSSNNYFLQSTEVYQQAATKLFAGSIFNGNKITVDSVGIKQKLQHQFPELADVSITLPLMGHRPIVYIAPTVPSLVLTTAHGDYILDDNGKALISTAKVADLAKLQLPTVNDQSGLAVNPNDIALPSTSVTFIQTVIGEFKTKGITVSSLTLPAAAYELDVRPTGVGYFVKFNLHESTARQQVGTFLAVQQRLSSQNITPGAYIDVRLDGRAYYK